MIRKMARKDRGTTLAALTLRLGVAAVFLYAGIASLLAPLEWAGYLPQFLAHLIAPLVAIKLVAVYEVAVSLWLLSGKYTRFAAAVAALTLAGILLSNPSQLIITFRDIGLLAAALALYFLAGGA
jgi:uncharacterized membrane protein YphA (DoxX/SURF4 family)